MEHQFYYKNGYEPCSVKEWPNSCHARHQSHVSFYHMLSLSFIFIPPFSTSPEGCIVWHTCCESSRVGAHIRPIGPSPGFWSLWSIIWSIRGHRKAAVLPLPVLAIPIISRPANAIGTPWGERREHDYASISVFFSYHFNYIPHNFSVEILSFRTKKKRKLYEKTTLSNKQGP